MGEDISSGAGVSFVIRLWLESREKAAPPAWRWHIQHVQSGDQAYFHRLEDVLRYIELRGGQPSLG